MVRTRCQLAADTAYDVPLVCTAASGRVSFAITQAHLQGYTGASLRREGQALRMRLSPVPNRPGPAFVSNGGLRTAWRVVMLGERAGDLIASNLVGNLNPPPEGDFSWVVPGKAAWDWCPTRRPIAASSTSRPPAACRTT
jgi:alpha-glucosidase